MPLAAPNPGRLIVAGVLFAAGLMLGSRLTPDGSVARYAAHAAWAAVLWGGWVLLGLDSRRPHSAPRDRVAGALGVAAAAVLVTVALDWAWGLIFRAP